VFIGKMSFVGPRPDVPGYADKLTGDDRNVLKLRPGITGPATLKYRLEDEYLANARELVSKLNYNENVNFDAMSDQEVAVWYNDNVIYPDKVRLNCYYYRHYSFVKDIQMILCTVFPKPSLRSECVCLPVRMLLMTTCITSLRQSKTQSFNVYQSEDSRRPYRCGQGFASTEDEP
jgi:hypothetical protein